MTPESFVVQIYRSHGANGLQMAGVVQRVGSDRTRSFKSAQELWTLLTSQGDRRRGDGGRSRVKPLARKGP